MLSCGHGFCVGKQIVMLEIDSKPIDLLPDCWQGYLSVQIKENSQRIKCPGVKCTRVVDEYTVLQLTDSKEVKGILDDYLYCS